MFFWLFPRRKKPSFDFDMMERVLRTAKGFTRLDHEGFIDVYTLAQVLTKHCGANVLGSGAYGFVVDCGDYVIKFFSSKELPYTAYVDFCLTNEHPLLPKIYSVHRVNKYINAVIIEKLKPLADTLEDIDDEIMLDIVNIKDFLIYKNYVEDLSDDYYNILDLLAEQRRMMYWECSWDLHTGNFMLRDNQLVITDPWCGYY